MKYFKKIEGERIYLSPVSTDDVEVYTKWMNDSVICKNVDRMDRIVTLTSEKEWLNKPNPLTLAIVLKENDEMIGNVGFVDISWRNRTAELGIFIGEEDYRGLGYGTEAIDLMLAYGFQYLNLHSVLLTVLSFNTKAITCYERLGFEVVGCAKETVYQDGNYYDRLTMEILEDEWRKNNEC